MSGQETWRSWTAEHSCMNWYNKIVVADFLALLLSHIQGSHPVLKFGKSWKPNLFFKTWKKPWMSVFWANGPEKVLKNVDAISICSLAPVKQWCQNLFKTSGIIVEQTKCRVYSLFFLALLSSHMICDQPKKWAVLKKSWNYFGEKGGTPENMYWFHLRMVSSIYSVKKRLSRDHRIPEFY
jgi:hypothetical protein